MTDYYIDPQSGNNANNGLTPATPWRTWAYAISQGVAIAGNRILGRRGRVAKETLSLASLTGSAGNPIIFGAYGDEIAVGIFEAYGRGSADIYTWFDAQLALTQIIELQASCSYVELQYIGATNNLPVPGIYTNAAFRMTGSNNILRKCKALRSGGVGFQWLMSSAGASITGSHAYDCIAEDCVSMGFHRVNSVQSCDFVRCEAINCGTLAGAHGFSGHPERTSFLVGAAWSVVSGSIYRIAYTGMLSGSGPQRLFNDSDSLWLTYNPGAFATLAANEWDVNGGFLYVNYGGTNPNTKNWRMDNNGVRLIRHIECVSYRQLNWEPYLYDEGHGFACDDGMSECEFYRCLSYESDGQGFGVNKGQNNLFVSCIAVRPERFHKRLGQPLTQAAFGAGSGSHGTKFINCTAIGDGSGLVGFSFGLNCLNVEFVNNVSQGFQRGAEAQSGTTFARKGGNVFYDNVQGDIFNSQLADIASPADTFGVDPLVAELPGGRKYLVKSDSPLARAGIPPGRLVLDFYGRKWHGWSGAIAPMNGHSTVPIAPSMPATTRRRQKRLRAEQISGLVEWWDFTDLNLLFTDTARTTKVTAAGQAIASAVGKYAGKVVENATLGQRPLWTAGGWATFDGTDDRLFMSTNDTAFDITGELTVVVAYRLQSTPGTYRAMVGKYNAGGLGWDVAVNSTNVLRAATRGSDSLDLTSNIAVTADDAHAVAGFRVTNEGGGLWRPRLFKDTLGRTNSMTPETFVGAGATANPMTIGNRDGSAGTAFPGRLRHVAVYNRALTDYELGEVIKRFFYN